jgi:hypothetical protein
LAFHRLREHPLAAWISLIGISFPSIQIFIAGAKFPPGRMAIAFLLGPALFELIRRRARFIISDLFACATAAWMIAAVPSETSTYAEIVEFVGAYWVARAYFFGRPAIEAFVNALKFVAIALIVLAMLDFVSRRAIVQEISAKLFPMPLFEAQYREGFIRATSTFDTAELYGTFCAVAVAIFLYSESSVIRRSLYAIFCALGCLLSISSGPLLALAIVLFTFCYDCIMKRRAWRWKLFSFAIAVFLLVVYFSSAHPVSWLVAHLTLDPSTGYWRVAVWDHATQYIALSPYFGFGFGDYGDPEDFFAHVSVDSVWLVVALRFGIPTSVLLLLTVMAELFALGARNGTLKYDPYVDRVGTGFTLAIMTLAIVGLTVHYWNALWIFWGLCIGIRGSVTEYSLSTTGKSRFVSEAFQGSVPLKRPYQIR